MKFRLFLNKMKLPGFFFLSKYGAVPDRNIDTSIVIGKAMILPTIENPTEKDVNKYYGQYLDNLQDLFDKNVEKYDPGAKIVWWFDRN